MKKRFAEIIDREVFHESSDGVLGVISAAEKCDTLHQQALLKAKKKALIQGVKMGIEAATGIIKKINKEL